MDPGVRLMERVSARDVGAFEALYDGYHRLVFGIGLRMLGDPTLAEDLTQTVFLKIWTTPDAFRGGSFVAWVSRVARNRALDVLRSQGSPPREPRSRPTSRSTARSTTTSSAGSTRSACATRSPAAAGTARAHRARLLRRRDAPGDRAPHRHPARHGEDAYPQRAAPHARNARRAGVAMNEHANRDEHAGIGRALRARRAAARGRRADRGVHRERPRSAARISRPARGCRRARRTAPKSRSIRRLLADERAADGARARRGRRRARRRRSRVQPRIRPGCGGRGSPRRPRSCSRCVTVVQDVNLRGDLAAAQRRINDAADAERPERARRRAQDRRTLTDLLRPGCEALRGRRRHRDRAPRPHLLRASRSCRRCRRGTSTKPGPRRRARRRLRPASRSRRTPTGSRSSPCRSTRRGSEPWRSASNRKAGAKPPPPRPRSSNR